MPLASLPLPGNPVGDPENWKMRTRISRMVTAPRSRNGRATAMMAWRGQAGQAGRTKLLRRTGCDASARVDLSVLRLSFRCSLDRGWLAMSPPFPDGTSAAADAFGN